MLAAPSAGAGLSTVALGLVVQFKRKGVPVAIAKVGHSLIDTTHYRRVSGRLSHSLDLWMLDKKRLKESFARLSGAAELVIIEAEGGFYDWTGSSDSFFDICGFSNALDAPVILVVDASGQRESIAATVKGFTEFVPKNRIKGIIANRVKDRRHEEAVRTAIELLNGPRFVGAIYEGASEAFADDGGAVSEGNPSLLARNRLLALGDLISTGIDLEEILKISLSSGTTTVPKSVVASANRRCRIAVADDAAFHLSIQDNLDLLRRNGAEIVAFSPLADLRLPPKTAGVYLPGGYVHLYAGELSANKSFIESFREFAASGGPVYAEGSAVAYLCNKVSLYEGAEHEMCGVLPGVAHSVELAKKIVEPIHCEVSTLEATIIGPTGERFRGVRDTRWMIKGREDVLTCYRVCDRAILEKADSGSMRYSQEGFSPSPHVLASLVHAHWGSNPSLARNFVDSVSANLSISSKQQGASS